MENLADDDRGAIFKTITDLLAKATAISKYIGPLSPSQIAAGMNTASKNALRLLEDAEILFNAERYPTAASVAILAIEEIGKHAILRSLSVTKDSVALKKAWKAYRSHQTKNVLWLFPLLTLSGVRTLAEFGPLFEADSKHREALDQLKQFGFYTDCIGSGEWSKPDEFVDEVIARFIIKTARSLTKEHAITEREIELWIKHVGSEGTPESIKQFWLAMNEEGLATTVVDDLDGFLGLSGP